MIIQHVVYGAEQGSLGASQLKHLCASKGKTTVILYNFFSHNLSVPFFMYIDIG